MEEAIRQFHTQFAYMPVIENADNLIKTDKFVVVGMGGSHLAAGLLKVYKPDLDLLIHRDYGLPRVPAYFLQDALIILSSYSGNTEEVIDSFTEAAKAGLNIAVITTGGKLLELAKEARAPYIQMPSTGIQPRSAIGYSLKALLAFIGDPEALSDLGTLAKTLDPDAYEDEGRELAQTLGGKVPVIYTSTVNLAIAYNWKIKFNETAKIPAFYNVLPELNHNEMTGFDRVEKNKALSERLHFIFLRDKSDHTRVQKRMDILAKLYADRGLPETTLDLSGETIWQKIFFSLLLADWTAFFVARQYGVDAEAVPMVEEFKRLVG